jgi:DNA-binding transcriptional LysR family regulator
MYPDQYGAASLMAAVEAGHEVTLLPSCVSGAAGRRLKLLKLRPALPPWCIVVAALALFLFWQRRNAFAGLTGN